MPDDKENIKKGNEGLKQQKDTIYSLNAEYEQVGNTIETILTNGNQIVYKKMSFNCLECSELLKDLYTKESY